MQNDTSMEAVLSPQSLLEPQSSREGGSSLPQVQDGEISHLIDEVASLRSPQFDPFASEDDCFATATDTDWNMITDFLESGRDLGTFSDWERPPNPEYREHWDPEEAASQPSPNVSHTSRDSQNSQSVLPEHYGPGYWLSICSSPGLAWVRERVRKNDFDTIGAELSTSWVQQLRLERDEPTVRTREPPQELAWSYSNAYFERSVDSLFDVIHRPDFERALRAHFSNRQATEDPACFALRNTVYATGCRLYHSEHHEASFDRIHKEAWSYFSNALSVHGDLLLKRPSLPTLRAVLAMALFAEGLGNPALGSGLMANAALLALSLGLHRTKTTQGSSTDPETLQRIWLFWAIYCCEKNIAQRTGRPSVIDDDDVECQIPREVPPDATIDITTFTYMIQTCQMSGRIQSKLMSLKSLEKQPAKMLKTVADFDRELRVWRDSVLSDFRPETRLKDSPFPRTLGTICIHGLYYNCLMSIHAQFAYPWITKAATSLTLKPELRSKIEAQIKQSSEAMATAARNVILMTRNFDLNGACTDGFMLHYPMHAFINLFIYVIGHPTLQSVRSDLALLDVAAGYFGQMDFLTGSKLSFPYARDIAALARQAVEQSARANPKISRPAGSFTRRRSTNNELRADIDFGILLKADPQIALAL